MSAKKYLARLFNPGIEPVMAKYLEYRDILECHEKREGTDCSNKEIILFCRQKLEEVEAALLAPFYLRKKIMAAWQLLHRVSEEMVLLMDREELSGFGLRLNLEVKLSGLPAAQKEDWPKQITEAVKRIATADCSPNEIESIRQLFKNMHRAVNAVVDDGFWDLWAKRLLALCYTVLLIALICFFTAAMTENACLSPLKILTLGAMGGLLSGIVTGERETLPKGHFWTPTVYYILARPALGAMAALVTFWMIESQFLIKIEPPLSENVAAFTCAANPGEKRPVVIETLRESGPIHESTTAAAPQAKTNTQDGKGSIDLSLVTLTAREGRQGYLYLLVLLFAGFAGDKLLKTIADRVTTKLIARAEKTKE